MALTLEQLPHRVREIVIEEFEVGLIWLDGEVPTIDIMLNGPVRRAAWLRDAVWYRLYHLDPGPRERTLSAPHIGRLFGKDHSTVYVGIGRHEKRLIPWAQAKNTYYNQRRQGWKAACDEPAEPVELAAAE